MSRFAFRRATVVEPDATSAPAPAPVAAKPSEPSAPVFKPPGAKAAESAPPPPVDNSMLDIRLRLHARLIDEIDLSKLDKLDDGEMRRQVRKLVGEQLPELLKGYARVPEPLRGVERNGKTPDAQLAEGLKLIDSEIGEMSAQLAQGDLDSLATRGRFLEIKYRDDDAIGS